ncbi:DUF5895 domain-containing protein [Chlorogloea sp. CCALA 695]|uniref:DUF5895 domain-containing protein n=1 Tax=Chlorogloea sp. CCALA 695 TaxID=2107693 RepID=UPI000D070D21|nr:DUF5895 domain-containing protein [Chlorogloea sp. CCALA 695]PSB25565.1 hypothetical protein C7B70_24685 [Chlorogloea sp. CCALA 695]
MTQSIERDQFVSDEFIDKNANLPTVIVLNDQLHCGYFIPVSTMAKCGWIDFDETQLISHTFRSFETEQGILIPNPRMLVCPKTELYQLDVEVSEQQKKRAIVGLYDAALKDDKNIKTERLYLVFFLDENNNPLHSLPLKYAARGVNGATFEVERRAFKAQLETCHALINQVPAKPKNDLFHALGVFCFTTQAELIGEKQNKSWCCRVVSHQVPTTENWKDYFVGYTHLKDYTWSALEPGQKIDVLSMPALETESRAVAALSPVEELDSLGAHKDSMTLRASHNGEAEDVGF